MIQIYIGESSRWSTYSPGIMYSKTSLYEYEAHQLELRIFRGILIKNYVILQNQSVRH
jgi:hypothetical protein